MSYSVSGTMITLTRGDTFSALITITDLNDNQYIPMNGDRIRFAMKNDYNDETPLLIKEIPIDTMILTLNPEDTKHLPFGKYVYDIELTKATSGSENMKPQAKTVTPSTAKQTILPDTEYNCLSQVEVEAIPYVEADNPAGGVTVTIAG